MVSATFSMGAAEDPQCQWCKIGRDNVGHLVETCPAVLPLLEWASLTRDSIGAMPPCLACRLALPIPCRTNNASFFCWLRTCTEP